MTACGDVSVVLLPVIEKSQDGVDEEEEDHTENNKFLHTDTKL